ncbi:hypothetical protein JAAARDRAFT_66810 [Jaapia argillacea MUCL 33604]|uniref:Uncharacterized protein n=1 Tax=Jaapia argillacea MUCL 33604 TaxID=933084 RepID=A0A067Q3V5_9AGAM|nr:hypothetical protein JAAARDRAFT_66810 [Jaapia argillacea MUCL 33604]
MTNSWRALAQMARDRIVATDPEDLPLVLSLWYLRLSSLARLRLTNQTLGEMNNLFSVIGSIQNPLAREYLFDKYMPFELEVMRARSIYWAGDQVPATERNMGYLDALYALVHKCKRRAREVSKRREGRKTEEVMSVNDEKEMWVERGARVCLIIASQLVEMKDYAAATKLLLPLLKSSSQPSPELRSAIAKIYLQSGQVSIASQHFAIVEADPDANENLKDMNASLLAAAEGDWAKVAEALQHILARDPENFAAVNNLSVALLSQGRLKEGIEVLEAALQVSPSSVVVAEPFLFNLSTLYELRSATAADKKRNLLIEVAKWSGDGLKTACLKMPSN